MSIFIKGDGIVLSIWTGVAYKPIGCLTSNSLSVTRNVIEAQTKCDPGQLIREAGSTSSEISFEAIFIQADPAKLNYNELLEFINTANGSPKTWRITSDQASPTAYYGAGILADLEITAAAGDEFATFSGTIQNSRLILTEDPFE